MSAIIRRSDQGRALRALVKALDPMLAKMDSTKLEMDLEYFPRAGGPTIQGTNMQTKRLLIEWRSAKDAVNLMDGK